MKRMVTCGQMKSLDAYTTKERYVPSCVLMERAALAVVAELEKLFGQKERVLVVCGSGNNGGDGIAAARLLYQKGIRADVFLAGKPEKMTEGTALQWKIARSYRVPEVNNPQWGEYTTIVDAIFGVGLTRPVTGNYAEIIRAMNAAGGKKVAVDLPSGIDGDSGRVLGTAFQADLTVTFAFLKCGLALYPGRSYAGRTVTADIGIYSGEEENPELFYLEKEDLSLLPARNPGGNKGTFGKVLLAAGSRGMCGAAYLSAAAALKAGAGMVKIQTVEENRIPLQVLLPEAMISCAFDEDENRKLLNWCDVLVIGPGLGVSKESRARVQWFLEKACAAEKPVILDADGLNLLSAQPEWKRYLNGRFVLTPHVGEMSRLCGKSVEEIQDGMAGAAVSYARETGAVLVLKDACTVTAGPSGKIFMNLSGNAGMAAAGSGDVLSGVIAALFCRFLREESGPESLEKAALGVYAHGCCGDAARKKKGMSGMTARDLVEALPEIFMTEEERDL